MALIIDTGPLYASIDKRDQDHARCAALLRETSERLVVPAPVVVETEWLVTSRLGAGPFDAFLADVEAGQIKIEELRSSDYIRVRELCTKYADLRLGLVDAAVIAVVERLAETKVATLDHRHFGVVKPAHVAKLKLVPD